MKSIYKGIDAIVVLSPSNLFYFTRYSNADAAVLLTADKKYYICDKRVSEEAGELLKDFEIVDVKGLSYVKAARNLAKKLGVKNLGYEDKQIRHAEYLELTGRGLVSSINLKPAQKYISELRQVKSHEELQLIRKAQSITDKVFSEILKKVTPGITEIELASFMNSRIYAYGGELAFEPIVAFGKNTSKPHAHPSDNKLQENDVITVDFGAKYKGYCSDMTRSFCIGTPPEGYKELYAAVLDAQNYAINTLKAGIVGKDGDKLARDRLKAKGYDQYFTHSLGHSLGVDIHESPNLSPYYEGIIPEGAVLSVEPGAYIEGKYGVRIEDIVVFQKYRVDNLTKSIKNLIIIE